MAGAATTGRVPALSIRRLRARAVSVPLRRPLTAKIARFERAPLLLIDLETKQGVTGHAYLFLYRAEAAAYVAGILDEIAEMAQGGPVAPAAQWNRIRRGLTLYGHAGLAMMALSGFDAACWDALARAAGQPLARLLGGALDPVPAYNSNGLGIIPPDTAAAEAAELLAEGGFRAAKVRVGRDTLAEDLAVLRAVREAVGPDAALPCDFNQALDVMEAVRRGRAFDAEDLLWIEEPIIYDDFAGCAKVAAEVATPIQIGENFHGPRDMADAIAAGAADYMMPDFERIGGVTGWLRAAALAETAGLRVSSHLMPEVSAQLLAVTPTAHYLEYVDWAEPILARPLRIEDGHAVLEDRPGSGIEWREDGVADYLVDVR